MVQPINQEANKIDEYATDVEETMPSPTRKPTSAFFFNPEDASDSNQAGKKSVDQNSRAQKNAADGAKFPQTFHPPFNTEQSFPDVRKELAKPGASSNKRDFSRITSEDLEDDSDIEDNRRAGRRKIKIEYIEDKSRRHITFSKRKAGIMKKVKNQKRFKQGV
jgi:hypothetical protein